MIQVIITSMKQLRMVVCCSWIRWWIVSCWYTCLYRWLCCFSWGLASGSCVLPLQHLWFWKRRYWSAIHCWFWFVNVVWNYCWISGWQTGSKEGMCYILYSLHTKLHHQALSTVQSFDGWPYLGWYCYISLVFCFRVLANCRAQ